MKKIKIAQIGMNQYSHSPQVFSSLLKQNDLFEVVGYALPENERKRISDRLGVLRDSRELSLEEILGNGEIEAVSIETDEIYLTKYALLAAKAHKHIHMEKPGGISLPSFRELIETVKKNGTVFHPGYMYRYNPYIQELLKDIKNGDLGEILSVEAQMNCIHPPQTRQWLQELPGGMMFYLGCHLVDLILQIKGQPERILPLNKCSHTNGVTSEDFGMAVFEYHNGISFIKTSACEIGGYARRQLVVSGTKKTVELKPLEMVADADTLYTGKTEYLSQNWNDMGISSKTSPFDRYDTMLRSFGEYILGEKTNPYTPEYELSLFQTILKCCGLSPSV